MKKFIFPIIVLVVTIPSLIVNYILWSKDKNQMTVAEVVDGDTFQLVSGKRVRLLGVDAPEYDRYGGPEAEARLEELIGGKTVRLAEERTEAFGRTQALVWVGGVSVNEAIMADGWGSEGGIC